VARSGTPVARLAGQKEKGEWLSPSPLGVVLLRLLEGVLEGDLNRSVTDGVRGLAGGSGVHIPLTRVRELQVEVIGQSELPQRVVNEIERGKPELEALLFGDLEVLVKAEVSVAEGRSGDVGPNKRAVGTDNGSSAAERVRF